MSNTREVMIIDDTQDVRLLTRKIVESAGFVAVEADSIDAAFRLLAGRVPNVILLDLRMPGKSGFDFLKARSAVPAFEAIPVIVVSASTEKESVYKAIGLGAADYIAKPLSASVLIKKIRKALKDSDFMTYKFEIGNLPKIGCSVPAVVSRPDETGFVINSPFKLNSGTVIDIESDRFRELELDASTFVIEGNSSLRDSNGCYFNRINVVGLKAPVARTLKRTGSG